MSKETAPKEQRGRTDKLVSGTLRDIADHPTARLTFRPAGTPVRPSSPSKPR
jgi:hypothetical protein